MAHPVKIIPYDAAGEHVVGVRPYDPRAVDVAARVGDLIRARLPSVEVEHVGSTAVPGCDGKGIVDLMVLCHGVTLDQARAAMDELGFHAQSGGVVQGNERPMREGATLYDGTAFRLHVHLVMPGTPPVAAFRNFRDRLRADPALVAEYVRHKREIVARGVSDRAEYTRGKAAFIQGTLAGK